MNPFKSLLFITALVNFVLVIYVVSDGESAPDETVFVPATVQIIPLTPEQEADRETVIIEEIAEEPVETSTTLPQLAQIDPDTKCQEWLPLAVEVGWPNETHVLQRLGQVMWKESRCTAQIVSRGGDHGLTQINQIHEKWLSEMGWTLDDMADPAKNLRFAFLLWNSREEAGKCGWQPWSLSC